MALASVLVVEDDPFLRTLISSALHSGGLEVVGSVGSSAEALNVAKKKPVNVAVLDLDLGPGPTGLELSIVLRRGFPNLGVVFLSSYQDPRLLTSRWDDAPVGARYIRKDSIDDARLLVSLILHVAHLPLTTTNGPLVPQQLLTHTQLEVLKGVAEGRSTKEIAVLLGVSNKAVEASISRVHRTLGITPEAGVNKRVSLVNAFYGMTGGRPPRA